VRLAARLTGWDIDILTPDEYNQGIERLTACVKSVEGGGEMLIDKLIALGVISVLDLDDIGAEPLVSELNIDSELAKKIIAAAGVEARNIAAEAKHRHAEEILHQESKASEKSAGTEKPQEKQAPEQPKGEVSPPALPAADPPKADNRQDS
jgi:N utilization substance protein A